MADHAEELLIVHQVHQTRIDAHATVRAGEGVDLISLVDLEIERNAIDLGETAAEGGQSLGIGVGCRQDRVLGVVCSDILGDIGLDVRVGEGHRLDDLGAAFHELVGVEILQDAAGAGGQRNGADCNNNTFHISVTDFSLRSK